MEFVILKNWTNKIRFCCNCLLYKITIIDNVNQMIVKHCHIQYTLEIKTTLAINHLFQ